MRTMRTGTEYIDDDLYVNRYVISITSASVPR
jgi:hypothetical protein